MKLYQKASAVYRENLGCPLSSPDTPYGENVQKRESEEQAQPSVGESVLSELKERMVEASHPNVPQGWLWQLEPKNKSMCESTATAVTQILRA